MIIEVGSGTLGSIIFSWVYGISAGGLLLLFLYTMFTMNRENGIGKFASFLRMMTIGFVFWIPVLNTMYLMWFISVEMLFIGDDEEVEEVPKTKEKPDMIKRMEERKRKRNLV